MPLNYCSLGFNEHDNEMLQDAEQAIDKANAWEYMKTEPGGGMGYGFCEDPQFEEICGYIRYDGHSGLTFGETMRTMQELAREGIDEFCAKRSQRIGPEVKEPVRQARTPEMDKKVIDEYKNVKPFKRVPKWAAEYATLYPQIVANLKFD